MERSNFDGTVLQLIWHEFLAGLLTAITFGIGYPWALCMLRRWETKHTIIESKRLQFTGKGLQLLGIWIVLAVIPVVVLIAAILIARPFTKFKSGSVVAGLIYIVLIIAAFFYSYYVRIRIKQWTIKHTEFEIHIPAGIPVQQESAYVQPGPGPYMYQASEKDWVDKLEPIMPLVYILWFCFVFAVTWLLITQLF